MVRENIKNYLGIPHNYETTNCITLIADFYKKELNLDFFKNIIPPDVEDRRWMRQLTLQEIDRRALQYGKKVNLTDAQDFDVIVFKSTRFERPIHFGLFLKPSNMLHLEEGKVSKFETISSEWVECIHAIYRHNDLV